MRDGPPLWTLRREPRAMDGLTVALAPEVVEGPLAGVALDQATDVAVRAFDDDPFFSYLFPKTRQRHRSVGLLHRAVMSHLGPIAVTRTALLDGKVVGVALWIPPGKWPYPAMIQVRQMLGAIHAFLPDVGSLGRGGRILRVVELAHPRIPQWYLQLLMVDPDVQRQGIGGLLQVADARGLRPRGAARVGRDPEGGEPRVLRAVRLRGGPRAPPRRRRARRCGRSAATRRA